MGVHALQVGIESCLSPCNGSMELTALLLLCRVPLMSAGAAITVIIVCKMHMALCQSGGFWCHWLSQI